MPRLPLGLSFVLVVAALCGCPVATPDAEGVIFPCTDDGDCGEGFTCDDEWSTCVARPGGGAPAFPWQAPGGDLVGADDDGVTGGAGQGPQGAPTLVFDDEFVRREGQPRWDERSFDVEQAGAAALVIVRNHGCAAADVRLNGAVVIEEADLNPNVEQLEREVTLDDDNELRARLRSKPGCSLSLVVIAAL